MFPSITSSSPLLKPSIQKPSSTTQQQDHHKQSNSSLKSELPLMIHEFDSMELEKITSNHQKNMKQNQQRQLLSSGSSYHAQNKDAEHTKPENSHNGRVPDNDRRSRNKIPRIRSEGVRVRRTLIKLPHQTADKFFGLHEMLGFRDENQTMDWLLTQSEAAIEDLQDEMISFRSEGDGTESSSSCSW